MTWRGAWVVEGERGLSPRSSAFVWGAYGGTLKGLWLAKKRQKIVQSQAKKTISGVPGLLRPKTGTMRFGPMAGLVEWAFDLILECTCFWPQTDQVYLFLAAAITTCCFCSHNILAHRYKCSPWSQDMLQWITLERKITSGGKQKKTQYNNTITETNRIPQTKIKGKTWQTA